MVNDVDGRGRRWLADCRRKILYALRLLAGDRRGGGTWLPKKLSWCVGVIAALMAGWAWTGAEVGAETGAKSGAAGQSGAAPSENRSQVVMLGSGTPVPDPERSGPAVAVVVNGRAYLVDCGPGVVRQAAKAAKKDGIPGLVSPALNIVFIP